MRTDCETPYRRMLAIAAVLRNPPEPLSPRRLRDLAGELAATVHDVDARLRAGLMPPTAWTPSQGRDTGETGADHLKHHRQNNRKGSI